MCVQDSCCTCPVGSRHVDACAGFLQQFAAVSSLADPENSLSEVLKELSGGAVPNRVLCCGHSLGGALATLGGCPLWQAA